MSVEARKRIESHRLMREHDSDVGVNVVDSKAEFISDIVLEKKKKLKRRINIHIVLFVISFIFTIGVLVLSVLLWVKPDAFFSMVVVGVMSAVVFVASFASLRVFVLHKLMNEYAKEEDPGMEHHISKSIAYAFIALVVAILILGLIVNIASADIL